MPASVWTASTAVMILLPLLCFAATATAAAAAVAAAPTVDVSSETHHRERVDVDDFYTMKPCPARCIAAQTQQQERHTSVPRRKDSSHQATVKTGSATTGARIFYLILVHNERIINDAILLFRAIRDPRNTIAIHYDRNVEHLMHDSNTSTLLREVNECPCGSNVTVASVHKAEWNKWSMNLATLWGMELAVSSFDSWDVFINLAGDTFPIYKVDAMAKQVAAVTKFYNFATATESGLVPVSINTFNETFFKRERYTFHGTVPYLVFPYATPSNGTKRPTGHQNRTATTSGHESPLTEQWHNKTLTIHFGSQWVILRRSFVQWLVEQLRDESSWPSQFREYLIEKKHETTDETFIPTILMHANNEDGYSEDFSSTIPVVAKTGLLAYPSHGGGNDTAGPRVRYIRYERFHGDGQRYQVAEGLRKAKRIEDAKPWGPYYLGIYDLAAIRESGALFTRKVTALVDPNIVRILPVDDAKDIPKIQWPTQNELAVSRGRPQQMEYEEDPEEEDTHGDIGERTDSIAATHLFTPWMALLGGSIMGASASLLLLANGDILGCSGILRAWIPPSMASSSEIDSVHWKLVFIAAFVVVARLMTCAWNTDTVVSVSVDTDSWPRESYLFYVVSGLLVGFGTSLGNGCISGHGICGLARCSLRSFVAVFTFLTTAIVAASRISPDIPMSLPPLHSGLGWIVTIGGIFAAIFATSRNQPAVVDANNWKLPGAALSGALFAVGLAVAGVTQTTKVLGFLNVLPLQMSTGSSYDPTWLIAMGSAVALSWCGYRYLSGPHQPAAPFWSRGNGISGDKAHFAIPTSTKVDKALLVGSVCFGLGWGLTGLCPGLALFAAAAGVVPVTLAWLPSFLVGSHVGQLAKLLLYGPTRSKANALA